MTRDYIFRDLVPLLAHCLSGAKWKRNHLTYGVAKYTKKLEPEVVDDVLKKAFEIWEDDANLKFTRTSSNKAIIDISSITGEHGDGYDFDVPEKLGVSRALAHGFFPSEYPLGGDIHFNNAEKWTVGSNGDRNSVDLLQVAVHEIGHTLGLNQSNAAGSIMNAHYNGNMPVVRLGVDDIAMA